MYTQIGGEGSGGGSMALYVQSEEAVKMRGKFLLFGDMGWFVVPKLP